MVRSWEGSNEIVLAPHTLQLEFSAAMRHLERRGLLDPSDADGAWTTFRDLPIRYVWSDQWVDRAIEIARTVGASRTYDSLYLACAEAFDSTLYTCDTAFANSFRSPHPNIRLVE